MDNAPKYLSQEQQEEFERFLLHQMKWEEETAFNKKLNADSALKTQFEEFKSLFFAVEEESLRTALEGFHKEMKLGQPTKRTHFNVYRIAAGIAILIALGLWFFNRQGPNERLFDDYFIPDPGLPTVMGTQDNYDFYEAMVDYKQGKYDTAIAKWERLLPKKPENDTLNYFLGVAYLAKGNHDKAIPFLKNTQQTDSKALKDKSYFFLGLSYLKQGDYDKSVFYLKKSGNEKNRALLKKLQNNSLK